MQSRLRVFLLAIIVLLPALATQGATTNVPVNHSTVAAAIAVSEPGDVIILAPGIYQESGLVIPAGIELRGGGATPSDTVLDGGGDRILLVESVTDSTVVSNLTFRNSVAVGSTSYDQSGGAIFISRSAMGITNCMFENNIAGTNGGAIRAAFANVAIRNCQFRNNSAPAGGGGAIAVSFGSSVTLVDCVFENNSARWGGAVSARSDGAVSLIDCTLLDNSATADLGFGGGIFADSNSMVGVTSSVLSGNDARYGGAAACFDAAMINMTQVTATGNAASVQGGGLLLSNSSPWLSGSIVAFNEGEGISLLGESHPVINCVDIYGNTGGDWTAPLLLEADPADNYDTDPMFYSRDPRSQWGLHLTASSPLVDPIDHCSTIGTYGVAGTTSPVPDVPSAGPGISNAMASPNPFNPRTNISFELQQAQDVQVTIYGLRGERIRKLAAKHMAAGQQNVQWEGRDQSGRMVGSGAYIVVVNGETETRTIKVTLLK